MTEITETVQSPSPGELVELFEIDTAQIGGTAVYRFTSSQFPDNFVSYNGNPYYRLDLKADGFEFTGKGQLPRPRVKVGLVGSSAPVLTLRAAIVNNQDLVGCRVTRRRTFRKYLDGQEAADWGAQFAPDLYVIERKVMMDNTMVEFELSALMDFQGKMLPGRQIIRDTCTHTYRRRVEGSWVAGSCPYTDEYYYKRDGTITEDPNEDDCGRRLSDCKLRFRNPFRNMHGSLPTRAFPGVARTRM